MEKVEAPADEEVERNVASLPRKGKRKMARKGKRGGKRRGRKAGRY